jgi:5-methyltetrahydrofolate--homocysteine methyltransferase
VSTLLYREDIDEVRSRLRRWWDGGDIGRPAMQITAQREEPLEHVEEAPEPEGWVTHYSTRDFAYRVNLSARACVRTHYLAESVPYVAPDLAPNCLALFLGSDGVEMPGTVWCRPCIRSPEEARFAYDPANFYWDFCLRLAREQKRLGRGKFLLQFPDLIEGLDTLAAMRGTKKLLIDLIERPDWVRNCLRQITDRYFRYYDILYDMMRDEVGGSIFWAWAPGRMAKFQCDFSAMISPAMFREFMVPVLTEMCERVSYCMYHWDGPGALPHHELLLGIPRLTMLQWTPGAGQEPTWHRKWWPYYHRSFEAGKKMLIGCDTMEHLLALKAEFGGHFRQFLINMQVESAEVAREVLQVAAD